MARDIQPNFVYETNIIMMDGGGNAVLGLLTGEVIVNYWRPKDNTLRVATKPNFAPLGNGAYRFEFTAAEVGTVAGELVFVAIDASGSPTSINYPGLVQIDLGGPSPRVCAAMVNLRSGDFQCTAFLQTNGQLDTTGTECRVTVRNEDGTVAIAQQTDAVPDAQGMFHITVTPSGLLTDRNYLMQVEIDSPAGNVQSYQGFSTV